MRSIKPGVVAVALTAVLASCSEDTTSGTDPGTTESATETPTGAATPSTDTSPSGVSPLQDGPLAAGRYRFVVTSTCDANMGCPTDKEPALPAIDITVPQGWEGAPEVLTLFGADAAVVLGWTNFWVGMNSKPCSRASHQKPDITVGPTVADFVDAALAHPLLNVTEPKPVKLGNYRGQFFSLMGPKDISHCEEWRPWDPGPYLQGAGNRRDIWVMNVNGVRVLIMAEYAPDTPKDNKAEIRAMVESIRFAPGKA